MSVDDTQKLIDWYIELNKEGTISDASLGVLLYNLIF